MNVPKPNLKAAKARADAARAAHTEVMDRHAREAARMKAEIEPLAAELDAAQANVRRQEDLVRLAKLAATAPDVVAALKADSPGTCPSGALRGLTRRPYLYGSDVRWTEQGRRLVALVAELSGVAS